MQPNKPDRPNRPDEQDGLAEFFSILLGGILCNSPMKGNVENALVTEARQAPRTAFVSFPA
jgi:hypothetical protein